MLSCSHLQEALRNAYDGFCKTNVEMTEQTCKDILKLLSESLSKNKKDSHYTADKHRHDIDNLLKKYNAQPNKGDKEKVQCWQMICISSTIKKASLKVNYCSLYCKMHSDLKVYFLSIILSI